MDTLSAQKNPAAVALNRRRNEVLSPERRREIAAMGGKASKGKPKKNRKRPVEPAA